MEYEKVYVHDDIWYIDNFLTQEELNWFRPRIDDPHHWYTTMRSPYKNIQNKFLNVVPTYDENGMVRMPDNNSEVIDLPIFTAEDGIWNRLRKVLPDHYVPHATLQSFKFMTDDEIKENLSPDHTWPVDFAMQAHFDPTDEINASFSLYLNDDFEGGELEFIDVPVKIEPKAGRLVVIITKSKLSHKVNKITSGSSRHTLYGNSWNSTENIPMSTSEDC